MKSLAAKLIAILLLALSTSLLAAATPYSQAEFDRLNRAGEAVLLHVHADWCPTCRKQAPIIDSLLQEPPYRHIALLRVDFDRQKAIVKSMGVRSQSTLILFKGGREVGRSLGETSRSGIERLLRQAR